LAAKGCRLSDHLFLQTRERFLPAARRYGLRSL
jgi:hypothetical protein